MDINDAFGPDVCADVSVYSTPERFDFVWASPPCTEFARESMPWCRTGRAPSLDLVRAAQRIIAEVRPRWWAIENVRGSLKHLVPILGPWKYHVGSLFIWGELPPRLTFPAMAGHKMSRSGRRPDLRSMVPLGVSTAVAGAIEAAP